MFNYIVLFILIVISYIVYQKFSRRKLPPGPIPWPIIGNLVELAMVRKLHGPALYELSKKYGSIYSLVIGVVPTVVVCGNETIRHLLKTEEFDNRIADDWIIDRTYGKKLGIIFSEGDFWKENRKLMTTILKDFGFGKQLTMEVLIQKEFEELVQFMKVKVNENNGTILVDNLFNASLANIVWSLVTGSRFQLDDPNCKLLVNGIDEFSRAGHGCSLLGAFPFLMHYLPRLTGFKDIHSAAVKVRSYLEDVVRNHRELGTYKTNPTNFIEVFLREIDRNQDPDSEIYTDENLVSSVYDLFFAGSETSANTTALFVRSMVQHPQVQDKVREEIDAVVGRGRMVNMNDKAQLRYTDATCLEILRFTNAAPLASRRATKKIQYGPYEIPKETTIVINYWSVQMEETIWGDPQNFRPERFLSPNGNIVNTEKLIAFGTGKRNCIGEVTARTSLFIGLSTLIQNFYFDVDPGSGVPEAVDMPGFTLAPSPFTIRLRTR